MSLFTAVYFVNSLFTPRSASFIFLSRPCQEDVSSRKGARKWAKWRDRARTGLPSSCPRYADSGIVGSFPPLRIQGWASITALPGARFYGFAPSDPCMPKEQRHGRCSFGMLYGFLIFFLLRWDSPAEHRILLHRCGSLPHCQWWRQRPCHRHTCRCREPSSLPR